jgi:hypothetical protein
MLNHDAARKEADKQDAAELPRKPGIAKVTKFHDHLDFCTQCRENQFALCKRGAELLEYEATGSYPRKPISRDQMLKEVDEGGVK